MIERQRHAFTKKERVTGKKRIENLFTNGQSFLAYPFRVVFIEYKSTDNTPASVLISVPKKRLKHAVKRNRIKRVVKESYRLNKNLLETGLLEDGSRIDFALIYIKDELSDYDAVEKGVCKALREISNRLKTKRADL